MAKEIERKFLVVSDEFKQFAEGVYYRQGYLSNERSRVVRVRVAGEKAFLTIKGASKGIVRSEYEYGIPVTDAQEMLDNLCLRPDIEKYRYRIAYEGFIWEVDEFIGLNKGLIVAEIELPDEHARFTKPKWVGEEVSHDSRYYNANLINKPYCEW